MAATSKMDLTTGSIPIQIWKFNLPLILTVMLQTVFHATDVAVVGHFSENAENAVAAVGAPGAISSLLLCVFFGMGTGVNVVIAQYMGAKDSQKASRAVHNSIALGIFCGILLVIVGCIFGKSMLRLIQTPDNVMDGALLYFIVTLWGMPAMLVYNFGCAILRAMGDTKQAMILLTISGVVNMILNMLFVIVFKMDVLGVALSTMLSKFLAMVLILRVLQKTHGACRFYLGKLWRIDFPILRKLLYNGIPAGLQSSCFALANMLVASAINSFGSSAIAASTVICFAEGSIINAVSSALHQTMLSFGGQNYGAKKYDRVWKTLKWCVIYAILLGVSMGGIAHYYLNVWIGWFINSPGPEVMEFARIRSMYMLLPCVVSIFQGISSGALRGLGYSIYPTIAMIFSVCIFRIWWLTCIYPGHKTFGTVLITYPISYILTIITCGAGLIYVYRKHMNPNRKYVLTGQ